MVEKLVDHEDMFGLYSVDAIDTNFLVAAIREVLLRTGLKLSH